MQMKRQLKKELQEELKELSEQLEKACGTTSAQIEVNKMREAELTKMRRDLEENKQNHETELNTLRMKHKDAVAHLTDRLEQMRQIKVRIGTILA